MTLTFGVLYCFFVIAHDRRRLLHCEVTCHPSSAWGVQQLRESFPYNSSPSYLVFDRATNFNQEVIGTIKNIGIEPKRTSFRSRGRAELPNAGSAIVEEICSTMGSCGMNAIGGGGGKEYIRYYHDDRTHLALAKETSAGRQVRKTPRIDCRIISMPPMGGLHHRYDLAAGVATSSISLQS